MLVVTTVPAPTVKLSNVLTTGPPSTSLLNENELVNVKNFPSEGYVLREGLYVIWDDGFLGKT